MGRAQGCPAGGNVCSVIIICKHFLQSYVMRCSSDVDIALCSGKSTRPRVVGVGVGADVGRNRQSEVDIRCQSGRRRGYRRRGGTRARRRHEQCEYDGRNAPRPPMRTEAPPRRVERTQRPHRDNHHDVTSTAADDAALSRAVRALRFRVIGCPVRRIDRRYAPRLAGRASARVEAALRVLVPRANDAAVLATAVVPVVEPATVGRNDGGCIGIDMPVRVEVATAVTIVLNTFLTLNAVWRCGGCCRRGPGVAT